MMEVSELKEQICGWCREPILKGQPTSPDFSGDILHFYCACQADDEDIFGDE